MDFAIKLCYGMSERGIYANKYCQQNRQGGFNNLLFDIKETKGGKLYLVITERRFKGEGGEREFSSVVVFPEQIKEFSSALKEMVIVLG